jgi:hypothetical protein
MVDVDCAVGAVPCLTPVADAGFEIDEAEVIYWGRCPDCLSQTPVRSGTEEEAAPVQRVPLTSDDSDAGR